MLNFAYNKPKIFIDVKKKLPSSKGPSQLNIFFVKNRRNTATTVQSDITTLTDLRKLTTCCQIQPALQVQMGKGYGSGGKKSEEEREETAPYPDKEACFQ